MVDTPPAVRHALSDLLEVLRRRLAYLDSWREFAENADLSYLAFVGPLPEPEEAEGASEVEWGRAARSCAKRLRIAGRPDLAEQVLAFVEEAPDMIAALNSAVDGTRRITPPALEQYQDEDAQREALEQYQAEKEARRSALEQYRAAKQEERVALERLIEQTEWLLEKMEQRDKRPERPTHPDQPQGCLTEPMTNQEIARWFKIHRNKVPEFLSTHPHEQVLGKVRLPVALMPPDWRLKKGIPID